MSQFQLPPNQPQYTSSEQYQPPPPPPKKRSRRKFFAIGCVGLVALVVLIGVIAAAASNGSTSNIESQATPTTQAVQATPTPPATHVALVRPTPEPTLIPTHAPQPTSIPTQLLPKPTPTPPSCQAVNNNPWCYNFSPGKLIYTPPSNFCGYFNCISSFWGADDPDDGYVVECSDSTFSQSGGESGACSYHGGVMRALYAH
jgi:hypothetical protein